MPSAAKPCALNSRSGNETRANRLGPRGLRSDRGRHEGSKVVMILLILCIILFLLLLVRA